MARRCAHIILWAEAWTGKYEAREYKSIGTTANLNENTYASFHNPT
jgi:hypothetical protein